MKSILAHWNPNFQNFILLVVVLLLVLSGCVTKTGAEYSIITADGTQAHAKVYNDSDTVKVTLFVDENGLK